MAPRETENNAYAKFGVTNKEHYGMLWYFLDWSTDSSQCFDSITLVTRYSNGATVATPDKKKTDKLLFHVAQIIYRRKLLLLLGSRLSNLSFIYLFLYLFVSYLFISSVY